MLNLTLPKFTEASIIYASGSTVGAKTPLLRHFCSFLLMFTYKLSCFIYQELFIALVQRYRELALLAGTMCHSFVANTTLI